MDHWGNAYVTGFTWDCGDTDAFIAKYDRSGNQVWMREVVVGEYEYVDSVEIAVDWWGNAYVVGAVGMGFWDPWDAYIAKYDRSGNQVWVKQFGTSGWDFSMGIAVNSWGICPGI